MRTAQRLASKLQGYLDGRRRMSGRELREVERFVKERADRLIREIRARVRGRSRPELSKALWGLKGSLKYSGIKDRKRLEGLLEVDEKIFTDLHVIKMALDEGREGVEELSEDLMKLREERKGIRALGPP